MPLYQIENEQNGLRPVRPSTFAEVRMRERQDLQALLRNNSSAIDPDLFIFAEEFSNWQDSARRVDLLALDQEANLVVIELKAVEEGGHMELQAVRYAAMLSTMTFTSVVDAYEHFLADPQIAEARNTNPAEARAKLLAFLGATDEEEVSISSTPRIILMSPSFSKEITTTVLWLNERELDIRCLEIKPYQIGGELYLSVEQVVPLPSADAYMVQRREKAIKAERQASTKRRERSLPLLVSRGILNSGSRLYLIRLPRPNLSIPDDAARRATFLGGQEVRWDLDNEIYSLSSLCRVVCERFGGEVGSGAFAGPDHWALEGDPMALSERARQLDAAD